MQSATLWCDPISTLWGSRYWFDGGDMVAVGTTTNVIRIFGVTLVSMEGIKEFP